MAVTRLTKRLRCGHIGSGNGMSHQSDLIATDIVAYLKQPISYTLTDDDGTVLDRSEGRESENYLLGVGEIVPRLE